MKLLKESKFNLSFKINVIVILLLFIVLFFSGFFLIDFVTKKLLENVDIRGQELVSMFAQINVSPISRMDYYSLEYNVKKIMENKDIVYVYVYDITDFELTNNSGKPTREIPAEKIRVYTKDVVDENNIKIGKIVLGLSIEKILDNINRIRLTLFLMIFVVLIFTIASISTLLNIIVKKPLKLLIDSINIIAQGNLNHRVDVLANDEIGILATNFNLMTNELSKNLTFIQNIIDSMSSIIITIDEEWEVLHWNALASNLTGVNAKDAIGKKLWNATNLFDNYSNHIQKVFSENIPQKFIRQKIKGIENKYFNIYFFPLVSKDFKGVVIQAEDITEIEKKEEQLRQAQKMETIGNLAGGLAHDLNNVLGAITGLLSLMKFKIENKKAIDIDELVKNVDIMNDASDRATGIIKQLLTLSRKQELSLDKVNLVKTINSVLKICKNTLDKRIEINFQCYYDDVYSYADNIQLEQVFLNILINASHAMTIMRPEGEMWGGKIDIIIDKVYVDETYLTTHPEINVKTYYWQIQIADNGVGMDSKTLSKIFDPFFTTKGEGKGTGLGLSMAYNIIKQLGGFIDVYSELGIGSIFKIYLPVLEGDISQKEAEKIEIIKGSGLVLVVDDEAIMREMSKTILEECGYEVLLAEDGEKGLNLYKENKDKIKLVILDLNMPKLSGVDVYKKMREIDQNVKVILSSGFKNDDQKIKNALDLGIKAFLQKPYSISKMSEIIASVLNKEN